MCNREFAFPRVQVWSSQQQSVVLGTTITAFFLLHFININQLPSIKKFLKHTNTLLNPISSAQLTRCTERKKHCFPLVSKNTLEINFLLWFKRVRTGKLQKQSYNIHFLPRKPRFRVSISRNVSTETALQLSVNSLSH